MLHRICSRFVLVSAVALVGVAPIQAGHVRVIGLGGLTPENTGTAYAINNRGQVVGTSGGRAVLWQATRPIDLGTLPGGTFAVALDINRRGVIVGWGLTAGGESRALLWQRGALTELEPLAGANYARALAINDGGDIVGVSGTEFGLRHAVRWIDGVPHRLFEIGDGSIAGMNNLGHVTGHLHPTRPFVWREGMLTELPLLPGATSGAASDINDEGWVVGAVMSPFGLSRAVLWRDDVPFDIGRFPGSAERAVASGVNQRGQIVGTADTADGFSRAFLWDGGTLYDLTPLPGGFLSYGLAVNDRGDVVGESSFMQFPEGQFRATLWRGAAKPPPGR